MNGKAEAQRPDQPTEVALTDVRGLETMGPLDVAGRHIGASRRHVACPPQATTTEAGDGRPSSGTLATRIEAAIERGQIAASHLPAACRLLVHLREVEAERETDRHHDFGTMMERVQDIARIAQSAHAVEDVLCESFSHFCVTFGFRRGLVSFVVDNEWMPERLYIAPDVEVSHSHTHLKQFLRQTTIPLADAPLEANCLRQKVPKLVSSPLANKLTYKPLMRVSNSPGYIVAPVVSLHEVVGIVHLDQFDEEATEADLDRLTLLTEVLGLAAQDVVRRRRLARFAERVEAIARSSIRSRHDAVDVASDNDSDMGQNPQLTRRERQVLDLITLGSSNAQIARELAISEATVKSHVGRLLTKLGVSTRAAAVAATGGRASRHPAR